jgi:hypothetical protein
LYDRSKTAVRRRATSMATPMACFCWSKVATNTLDEPESACPGSEQRRARVEHLAGEIIEGVRAAVMTHAGLVAGV